MQVILTHEHADFDAVASQVGLARLVPEAVAILPQRVNSNVVDFLTLYGRDLPLRRRDELDKRRERIEHVWLVDTQQAQPVRGMTPMVPRTILDHHPVGDLGTDGDAPHRQWDLQIESVGATSTIVTERLIATGVRPAPIELTLLLLGIHEDTGSLTYGATTGRDLSAAAWLLDSGADLDIVSRFLRYPLTDEARELLSELQTSASAHDIDGRQIVTAVADGTGYDGEISTLTMKLMDLLAPSALFVLVDVGSHVQLVARSLSDAVDVGAVAQKLGGGGHERAAAAVIRDMSLDEARTAVETLMPSVVRPTVRVADIMSRGRIRSLQVAEPIGAALDVARRHGHEGYPVLDGDTVVGIVTRHEMDRAVRHGLSDQPVGRLIGGPAPVVEPTTSLAELRRVMTQHDVGQVPVVDSGTMIGIVTRTDVLRRWATMPNRIDEPGPRVELESALTPHDLDAVRRIAAVADGRGERAFLVGGMPRDLLLGRPPGPDIDLVVEGEAEELARAVAELHGGRVVAHSRFGTAKWVRDTGTIDLVSARAEFYSRPTALPDVERGSLKSDLRRRDFTINALAISLTPNEFGNVVDHFNGLEDLRAGRLRVLHSLSFVEDPTRILRAARLEARLGFAMGDRTAKLVPDAVGLLQRVSGARLHAEFRQLFAEPDPTAVLTRLAELAVLDTVQHGLHVGERIELLLEALPGIWAFWQHIDRDFDAHAERECALALNPTSEHGLLLWLAESGRNGIKAARRLDLAGREQGRLARLLDLCTDTGALAQTDPNPSELNRRIKGEQCDLVALAWHRSADGARRQNLLRYATQLANVRTFLTGDDLADLGVPPGPIYSRVLSALLDARMQGTVLTRDEEIDMARRLLAEDSGD